MRQSVYLSLSGALATLTLVLLVLVVSSCHAISLSHLRLHGASTRTNIRAEAELVHDVTTSQYPLQLWPLCMNHAATANCYTPAEAREAVRHPRRNDANAATCRGILDNYVLEPGTGRVMGAKFVVGPANAAGTNPGEPASNWCDVAWNHGALGGAWHSEGAASARNARVWNSGHIIAASLGGTNADPINFFPLHFLANQEGRWKRAEEIAFRLNQFAPGKVHVHIIFNYQHPDPTAPAPGTNLYVPIGGTYQILMTVADFTAAFHATLTTPFVIPPRTHNDVALWARKSTTGFTHRSMTITWRNQGDKPLAAPRADCRDDCIADPNLF